MTNQSSTQRQIEQHLQLWIYLLPIVGVVPAVWTLYRTRNNKASNSQSTSSFRQRQKASRLSVNLMLIWLSSYTLFTLGATNAAEIVSFRLLYANAILTTGYFVTCTWLMSRLVRRNSFSSKNIN